MTHLMRWFSLLVTLVLVACASATTLPPTATSAPTSTATSAPPTLAPTSLPPPTATPPSPAVTFPTADGATLQGTWSGEGSTVIVFSTMGGHRQETWTAMAEATAQHGYRAFTFNFRFWVDDDTIDRALQPLVADDLRAAIAYVRAQGAERVILVGASLGGMATAKVGASENVEGLVILAAPPEVPDLLTIEAADLATSAPKLFVSAERDHIVPLADTQALFDLAAEPKEWQTYPGTAHGTELFDTASGPALTQRLLDFFDSVASTPPPPFFTVYGDGPIVSHGAAGAWDDRFTDPGAMVYHDGQFHMFRNGFRDWPASVQIGYVTSPDGYIWTKSSDAPVLESAEVPYAGVAALASSILVEDDGTWVLYFYTWQSASFPSTGGIGRATAPGPTGPWSPDPDLVLKPGKTSAWDGRHVLAPHVLRTEAGYVMYYSGYNLKGQQWIGRATSSDGIQWVKYDDSATTDALFAESDPVFQSAPGEWDGGDVHQPRVFETPEGWVMFYRGTDRLQSTRMALGVATSTDGLQWERSAHNPVLTPKAVAGAQYFWFTNVLFQANTYFLFWEVDINQSTEIYLATHLGPIE